MPGFLKNEQGGLTIYSAMFAAIGIGAGAVAIDYGRMELLRTEMQHAADASALSGVVQLTGQDGAMIRADKVAFNAMSQKSNIPGAGTGVSLAVKETKFYSEYFPTPVEAATDLEAKFMEVTLQPQTVNLMFAPVLNMFGGGSGSTSTLNARAVARVKPFVCHAPPLMMCDLSEEDPVLDPAKSANIGRQVVLKEPQSGGGTWAPGNFGLLSLPDGSSGAADISVALAATKPNDCYEIDVITATGSKTDKVKEAMNVRFDISTMANPPAPNVISYPRDADLIADPLLKIGNGVWDLTGYWLDRHGAGVPVELTDASRYQVYLYELGKTFSRNGKKTLFPSPVTVPAGYTEVIPPGKGTPTDPGNPNDPKFDGVPSKTPASNGQARRLITVALLQCIAEGINGKGTYPTNGKYVEMFLTEPVEAAPEAAIRAEIVRSLSSVNDPEFHANASLVK